MGTHTDNALNFGVDPALGTVTRHGDLVVIRTDDPIRVWDAVTSSQFTGAPAVVDVADELSDRGVTVEVTGPDGLVVRLGAGIDSKKGLLATGSRRVELGGKAAAAPLAQARLSRTDPRRKAAGAGALLAAGAVYLVVRKRKQDTGWDAKAKSSARDVKKKVGKKARKTAKKAQTSGGGDWATGLAAGVTQARDAAGPALSHARDVAAPAIVHAAVQARDLAAPKIAQAREAAAPRIAQAREAAGPTLAQAAAQARENAPKLAAAAAQARDVAAPHVSAVTGEARSRWRRSGGPKQLKAAKKAARPATSKARRQAKKLAKRARKDGLPRVQELAGQGAEQGRVALQTLKDSSITALEATSAQSGKAAKRLRKR